MTSKILDRTSCRNYLPKSIPAKIIRQFKNIINSSPTAINAQPFSAIFITNKKMINELIKFNFNQTFITQTPLVVLFLADLNRVFHNIKMENGSMWYMNAITDSTIACTLLMSSANELGLGTCILGGFRRWPDGVNKLLNIKGKIAPALALCIGYKSKEGTNVPKINKCYDEHYDLKTVLKEASSYDEKMKKFYKKITNKEISWKEMVNKNLIKLAPYDSEKQIKRIFEIK